MIYRFSSRFFKKKKCLFIFLILFFQNSAFPQSDTIKKSKNVLGIALLSTGYQPNLNNKSSFYKILPQSNSAVGIMLINYERKFVGHSSYIYPFIRFGILGTSRMVSLQINDTVPVKLSQGFICFPVTFFMREEITRLENFSINANVGMGFNISLLYSQRLYPEYKSYSIPDEYNSEIGFGSVMNKSFVYDFSISVSQFQAGTSATIGMNVFHEIFKPSVFKKNNNNILSPSYNSYSFYLGFGTNF